MTEKTFRYARWLRIVFVVLVTVAIAVLVAGYPTGGWLVRVGLVVFLGVSVGGFIEILVSKIELRSDGLLIATLFGKRLIPKDEIESVTWESGSGVSVKLSDGSWARLPDLGHKSQGVANSVRAWIKRQENVP